MECRRVHVLRPRVSTSGGQSFGGALRVAFLVWEAQEANEVQERQLEGRLVDVGGRRGRVEGLRLAVLAEDDAFGELLWWDGGCGGCGGCGAVWRGCAACLRFCAVGCHLDLRNGKHSVAADHATSAVFGILKTVRGDARVLVDAALLGAWKSDGPGIGGLSITRSMLSLPRQVDVDLQLLFLRMHRSGSVTWRGEPFPS